MSPRWPRFRRARQPAKAGEQGTDASPVERPQPERGLKLLLECHDNEAEGTEILAELSERYEITALGGESRRFEVLITDAVFPDEGVVRLASVLDEIDPDWVQHIRWPKVRA